MMTFRQLAFNNVFRNRRIYAAYFLSSLFTVMVFFTFANFAFHPTLSGDQLNANVTKGMLVAGGIIYVFSFFFILYSMSSFLQSRKKEFGIFMIQGMARRQVRWMVFLENMIIGILATVFGIGLGLVFAKVILLIAENVLVIEDQLNFYFPTKAVLLTFISFILLFLLISVFVTFVLRTNKLVTLIKGDVKGKEEPKASIWLSVLATILLVAGYVIALFVDGGQVIFAFIPVVIIVTIGTYFLFTQLSVFVIHRLKNRKELFWKETNILLFSDLSHRLKDNARAFFMVAIISTVAFSAIGTLFGFNSFLTKGLKAANPLDFTIADQSDEELHEISRVLDTYDLETEHGSVTLSYFEQDGQQQLITTPEQYNTFANLLGESEIHLDDDEVTVVSQSDANMMVAPKNLEESYITLADDEKVYVDEEQIGIAKPNVLPEINYYYIVGEEIFSQLAEPMYTIDQFGWQVINGNDDDILDAGRELTEQNPSIMAIDWVVYDVHKMWGPVMFVGLFIGIVFFISAGSFLYFRLYTDLDEDKYKFNAIGKIGLTIPEIKRVISRQIAILFFAPIVVALFHGAVALVALSNMFDYNLVVESTVVLASFFVIQLIYFFIVRYLYTRQVILAIQ